MTESVARCITAIAELAKWRRWVLHVAKRPVTSTGAPASSTDPRTWADYAEAAAALDRGMGDGLGFVFTETPYAGADLDGCIGADGLLAPWAGRIVERLNSYTERSPSGRGLHVIVEGALPGPGRRRGAVELYDTGRYFTVTGSHWPGSPATIRERPAELAELAAELRAPPDRGQAGARRTPSPWNGDLPQSVAALCESDATVRLALHKRCDELGQPSPSEADWMLARRLAEWGVGIMEIEAALRWRHAHIEPRPKSLDYFSRTAGNAAAQARGQQRAQ